ncbi:MAG: hypothetical protein GX552_16450 [Chloroflexi bacterium]|nr:hypothetical protein [Chloroflexota bacterium]
MTYQLAKMATGSGTAARCIDIGIDLAGAPIEGLGLAAVASKLKGLSVVRNAGRIVESAQKSTGAMAQSLTKTTVGNQTLFYTGVRQQQAFALMQEAAEAAGVRLGGLVDDVVFTTGKSPWFNVINGRRVIAISQNVLRKTEAGRLIAAVHELSHARHATRFGIAKYRVLYAMQRGRIEALVEMRALRTVDRYLGGLSPAQRADSMRYIANWL